MSYCCLAYDYNNDLLAVPQTFENEDDAWDCIAETMKRPDHPKMMWVHEGEYVDGNITGDSNSSC